MPLTPFHIGPTGLLGLIFKKYFDIFSLVISNVIVDLEPIIVIVFNLNYPIHGFFHSFIGCSIILIILSILIYLNRKKVEKFLLKFKIKETLSFRKIFISSLIGIYSHIILDSFLYQDIKPFYPSSFNPFLNLFSFLEIYLITGITLVLLLIFYLVYFISKKNFNT